jgi:hypothetical protein
VLPSRHRAVVGPPRCQCTPTRPLFDDGRLSVSHESSIQAGTGQSQDLGTTIRLPSCRGCFEHGEPDIA